MTERVRTVQHGRRGRAQRAQDATSGQQIADERLAAGNQLVGENVPWSRFQPALTKQGRQLASAIGANGEVVLEDDALSVEQEALAGPRRVVEQFVDELDESLLEPANRVIPLAVPVGV